MIKQKNSKRLLFEVSYIRPIVIFLLVFLHSFEKIAKGGLYTHDYQLSIIYQWILELIKGFRIETIAMVAGYVFAYQSIELGRKYEFVPFVRKKFDRLIIPMLFFGLIYYFCFLFDINSFSLYDLVLKLLTGCGHLWFLPMLFWCFIGLWAFDHFGIKSWKALILLAMLSIIPSVKIPLGFSRLPHFLFYVYGGYYLWTKHDKLQNKMMNYNSIVLLWAIYVSLVIALHYYKTFSYDSQVIFVKGSLVLLGKILALVEACIGTIALYLTICKMTTKKSFTPSTIVVDSSKVCYGVYVYHQFILVYLYFYTTLYDNINEYLLPLLGFFISMIVSLLLTRITLNYKIGRKLIG